MPQLPNQQLPPYQQPQQQSKGLNPRLITIISSIIILIIIIAISLYWFLVIKPQVESQPSTSPSSQEDTTPTTPSTQANDTSNWFLYVNTQGKYRLKYPPSFKKTNIKEEDLDPYTRQHEFQSIKYKPAIIGQGFSSEGEGSVFFVDVCEKEDESCIDSISKLDNKSAAGEIKNLKEVKIDGVDAKRFEYKGSAGELSVNIEFKKDEKTYSIKLDHGRHELDSDHLELFNLMLETFEFIN